MSAAAEPGGIDAVVFDLGGVLIDWSPYHLYRKLLPDDAAIAAFLDEIGLYQELLVLDTGETTFTDWAETLKSRHPAHATLIDAYRTRWHETIAGVFADGVAVVERLKSAEVPLYVLSNWGIETWQEAHEHHHLPFLDLFDGIVISGEEGLVKPDAAIFSLLCERFGLSPERAVFIDDNAANVAVGARLGFHTIHHHGGTGAASLRKALADLGLPVA